jgi:hypothetical protein
VLWSGVKGEPISDTFRGLLSGKPPAGGQQPITGTTAAASSATAPAGDTGASSASAAANQAIAKLLAAPYGWSVGQQWADLVSLWNRESGWSATATNPSSGAFGIPQALGHGTSVSAGTKIINGTTHNEYPNTLANNGDATAQIAWGLNYIHGTYGSPSAAWAHEESAGWY